MSSIPGGAGHVAKSSGIGGRRSSTRSNTSTPSTGVPPFASGSSERPRARRPSRNVRARQISSPGVPVLATVRGCLAAEGGSRLFCGTAKATSPRRSGLRDGLDLPRGSGATIGPWRMTTRRGCCRSGSSLAVRASPRRRFGSTTASGCSTGEHRSDQRLPPLPHRPGPRRTADRAVTRSRPRPRRG